MGVVSKVFFILVPLVFVLLVLTILFINDGGGLLGEIKQAALGAKDVLPKVSVGLEEQKAEVTIPDEHREQILNLQKAIVLILSGKSRDVKNENCFADYGGFSALGEEAGTSVTFESRGDKAVMKVFAGSGGKQNIDDLSADFSGMKPCVIAGEGAVSEHFFKHFITEEQQLIYPYSSQVNSLRISGADSDTNGINIPELDLQNNLEDGGWLFTPDGEHICFFPTNLVSDYDDTGIDNNFFIRDRLYSIPSKIKEGKLNLCS